MTTHCGTPDPENTQKTGTSEKAQPPLQGLDLLVSMIRGAVYEELDDPFLSGHGYATRTAAAIDEAYATFKKDIFDERLRDLYARVTDLSFGGVSSALLKRQAEIIEEQERAATVATEKIADLERKFDEMTSSRDRFKQMVYQHDNDLSWVQMTGEGKFGERYSLIATRLYNKMKAERDEANARASEVSNCLFNDNYYIIEYAAKHESGHKIIRNRIQDWPIWVNQIVASAPSYQDNLVDVARKIGKWYAERFNTLWSANTLFDQITKKFDELEAKVRLRDISIKRLEKENFDLKNEKRRSFFTGGEIRFAGKTLKCDGLELILPKVFAPPKPFGEVRIHVENTQNLRTTPFKSPSPDDHEHLLAVREGEWAASEDSYFGARKDLYSDNNARFFHEGFNRGWDARAKHEKKGRV